MLFIHDNERGLQRQKSFNWRWVVRTALPQSKFIYVYKTFVWFVNVAYLGSTELTLRDDNRNVSKRIYISK